MKQSCSSPREISNGVSHSTYMHRVQVDSRLLVVGSQIANLTFGPSFSQYEAIFDIYTLIDF